MTPYGDIELGQRWTRWLFVAWSHQMNQFWVEITGIHPRAISQQHAQDKNLKRKILYFEYFWVVKLMVSSHIKAWTNWSTLCKTWWRHQMETFSALLAICAGNSPVPVNSPHKGQWRGALMFYLICVWRNDWVNHREAGDLRRYRAHYDVIVMDRLK